MNNTIFLIIFISIFILVIKYISDLRSNDFLIYVLIMSALPSVAFGVKYFLGNVQYMSIAIIAGMIIAPLVFSFYVIRKSLKDKQHKLRWLSVIPALSLATHYALKLMHAEGANVINLAMIAPLLIGLFIIFGKRQLEETKPLQIFLIFMILDLIEFYVSSTSA